MKQKRDNVLTKRNKVLCNRDNVNAKYKKIINLLNKMMTNERKKKKNDNVDVKRVRI